MPKPKAPDLNNIRYLIEVADSGSFSAAARVFGVPPSLVSRRIAQLEQELGTRLFQRTTRSLALTDAGHAFLTHARSGMQSLAMAQESLAQSEGVLAGRVRMSVPVGTADAVWAALAEFLKEHPGIRVEIEVSDGFVNLVEERFDLALRAGPESNGNNLIGRRLLAVHRHLVASPAYLDLRGRPRNVSELQGHDFIVLNSSADRVTWHLHSGRRVDSVVVQGRIAVNVARLAADCAADGFGIAFLPSATCAKHVESGRLERVLNKVNAGESALWLVYPDRHLPAVTRALLEQLAQELPKRLGQ